TRRFTCGGLDGGAKPAVASAIAKYNFTETMRDVVNDAMDICGGAGISRGPRNLLAHAYFAAPISITVEGANILTRTLMIFGQGAIRCHPFAENEITALENGDVKQFDFAFFGHIGHVTTNLCRSLVMNLSRGHAASVPFEGRMRRDYQKLSWASSRFAILADLAMGSYGGDLKRKEMLTGRFSDVLSWMYIASALLRRYEAEGRNKEDYPLYRWSMDTALHNIQHGFNGLYANFDMPIMGAMLRGVGFFARINRISNGPSDKLTHRVATLLQTMGDQRDRLTEGIYVPKGNDEAMAKLENAFRASLAADKVAARIKEAIRGGDLPRKAPLDLLDVALEKGVINENDFEIVRKAEELRTDAITVDSFSESEYLATALDGGW
ncbi:MAG: DUF1974 domain-containing protein, partial [Planctomycetota bacterium]|nr:DUF1974 domain-containing protein [Planctomycetota bacterium]